MKQSIIESVKNEKIIVIVRGVERDRLIPLAEAMYNGGIRLLEITFDSSGKTSDEETASRIAMLKEHFGDRMRIGAGTVLNTKQVELVAAAGGEFIISPNVKREVIERSCELSLVSMPGALTPSEIADAYDFGADLVKLFPVTSMGPGYVKAVRAPLSHIPMLAVGGVDLDNIKDYLDAGVCGFGLGSNIVDKKMLENGDFDGITRLAATYVKAIRG